MKSRVTGDCHARFRENVEVKFLGVTRLAVIVEKNHEPQRKTEEKKNENK
jgi:hypothetical protein